jgi:hypothetical protein
MAALPALQLSIDERVDTVRRFGFAAYAANNNVLDTRCMTEAQLAYLRSYARDNFDHQDAMHNRDIRLYIRAIDDARIDDASKKPARWTIGCFTRCG